MSTAVKLLRDEKEFAREIREYVEFLERQADTSNEQAKAMAIKALKQTGVINKNGSPKKKIVSWE